MPSPAREKGPKQRGPAAARPRASSHGSPGTALCSGRAPDAHDTRHTRPTASEQTAHTALRRCPRHAAREAACCWGTACALALQKAPPNTGSLSGQIFSQRRNPGWPECEHRCRAPGRGPQHRDGEGLDSVSPIENRGSQWPPAGRARWSEGEEKRQELDRTQERSGPQGGVKRPGGRVLGLATRAPAFGSRTVWPHRLHEASSRAAVPTGGACRGPHAQQQLMGEAAPRTGRPSWSWRPRPPQGPAPPSTQNHKPRAAAVPPRAKRSEPTVRVTLPHLPSNP